MPPVAKVEPITTARALRGPFDYLRPDGVRIGSVLVVPFGHRDVVGVVVGLAETSELADERLASPRRVLDHDLPPELVELAVWMADEYCSTPARALALVSPPRGARAKLAWWAQRHRRRRPRGARRRSASASCSRCCRAPPAPTCPRCAAWRRAGSSPSSGAPCGATCGTRASAPAAPSARR